MTRMRDLIERLRHAITTASNDDLSEPGSEKRQRHVARLNAMEEAADALAAAEAQIAELREALEPFARDGEGS